ncbi:Trypsin-like peptidase domain-containing protein [Paenibacillus sophorae]|uniref:Trypsin-like peptidase domain-containing protein n=1 Tax=Paenibacillus sophorae TaxID=1333845 RepID=A0A1H8L7K2_9BACL|nr:serine protease [Paenibacillus sophorae]SEO01061.1 Trypsin-like peptidase domain-containing protein [Paenibacillus sophorae]
MEIKTGLSEHLMYSTVRIECLLGDGTGSTGTGFFFSFLEDGNMHVPAIVTNKHVVAGAIQGRFLMTVSDSEGNPKNEEHLPLQFDQFQSMWIFHPDPNVDLCIMPIAPLLKQADDIGKKLFFSSLTKDLIPTTEQLSELSACEDVTMVGYPIGIWDQINNLPLIRRGITATHPKFNYNGKEEIMIDAACYPGSSGSPVLVFNEGSFLTKNGLMAGTRVLFLGVMYGGPQFTATGEIAMMNIPTSPRPVAFSHIPMNLGLVIKAHKILDFEELLSTQYKERLFL